MGVGLGEGDDWMDTNVQDIVGKYNSESQCTFNMLVQGNQLMPYQYHKIFISRAINYIHVYFFDNYIKVIYNI